MRGPRWGEQAPSQQNISKPSNHHRASVVLPALVVLIGLALRLAMLGVDERFHPDEALFAAQARLISYEGDWLLRTTDLDKPPLTFYATATSFRLLGPSEFAARLPNVLFSALSVAALVTLARSLYHDDALAALAGLLLAISPYDLAFSATVFTDAQATFWTLIAALFAVRDRWRGAGFAAALMFAAKTNALLFLPLVLALGITHNADLGWQLRDVARRLWRFAWPVVIGIGIVVVWDMARAPRSFLELGYQRNNPGRFVRSDEVWARLEQWGHWFGFITGSDIVNGLALAGGLIWLAAGLRRPSRATLADWQIAGFGIGWLAWHWLIAFNTYDRYLHTLAPFVILFVTRVVTGVGRGAWIEAPITARMRDASVSAHSTPQLSPQPNLRDGVKRASRFSRRAARLVAITGLVALMLPSIITTLRGDAAIGGDQGQHAGIDALADYLNTELRGAVVYDHWLGWELAYYLGQHPQIRLMYQPLPEALAQDMRQQSERRFFVAPSPDAAAPWLDALRRARIEITIMYHAEFVLYALEP
jgi:hypothetical protein